MSYLCVRECKLGVKKLGKGLDSREEGRDLNLNYTKIWNILQHNRKQFFKLEIKTSQHRPKCIMRQFLWKIGLSRILFLRILLQPLPPPFHSYKGLETQFDQIMTAKKKNEILGVKSVFLNFTASLFILGYNTDL